MIEMSERQKNIAKYCDGIKTSKEISLLSGDNMKYVQRTMKKFDLPRLPQAPRHGIHNPSWNHGRSIDHDGYVIVRDPEHPYARKHTGFVLEHRYVVEYQLGRYLKPHEVVDHIDGLKLNNDPKNLRVFSSNAEHLKHTLTGRMKNNSPETKRFYCLPRHEKISQAKISRIDNYSLMKKCGDVRLHEILCGHIALDKDSPYLLGTSQYLKRKQIHSFSRSNLIHELEKLYQKWGLNPRL